MLKNSLFVSLILFPLFVCAEPTPEMPPPPPPLNASPHPATRTIADMEDIQAQTMLYKAQFLRDKALVDLQKLSSDGDSRAIASAPLPYDTSITQTAPAAPSKDAPPPQVIQITGAGKTTSALIRTSGGNQMMVQAGNTIPGTNMKVEKVTLDAVTVSRPGKQPWLLAFAED